MLKRINILIGRLSGYIVFVVTILGLAASCGPSVYLMDVELRKPSHSGFDLVGKRLSVVFLDNGDRGDSVFIATVANAFADKLDEDYFGGDSLVQVFSLDKKAGAKYDQRDTMVNLIMDTDSDVIFLFDSPDFLDPSIIKSSDSNAGIVSAMAASACMISLNVYDSMNKKDTVMKYSDSRSISSTVSIDGTETDGEILDKVKENLVAEAEVAGKLSAEKFKSRWGKETLPFMLLDSDRWYTSIAAAASYDWKTAMEMWISMLDTKNLQRKACLEYDLAIACYIQGQYELAMEWIDLSGKDMELPSTSDVKKMVQARLQDKRKVSGRTDY